MKLKDTVSGIYLAAATLALTSFSLNAANVTRMMTEHLLCPVGIDNPAPRFSWTLEDAGEGARQTSYRITVSSDEGFSDIVWDSGEVDSDAVLATYCGSPLSPFTKYWWKVSCKLSRPATAGAPGTAEEETAVSVPATFETGMMSQSAWTGGWITDSNDRDFKGAPMFRKEFSAGKTISEARAYIAAAGLYVLNINGRRIGDRVLDPAFTRYDRRILYAGYDVTDAVRTGANAVGVELGNGWYNHQAITTWHFDRAPWRARPAFCMDIRIKYTDGSEETVATGSDWKTFCGGPRIYNNIYTGEHYDARLLQDGWSRTGFDDAGWNPAKPVSCPASTVSAQAMSPIRNIAETEAVSITKIRPTRWVYDFGANMAGNVHLHINGHEGVTVTLKYSERLGSDGRPDQSNIDVYYFGDRGEEPFQTDIVTLGKGETDFTPEFSYKGFRYVEVNLSAPIELGKDEIKAVRVNSDVPEAGTLTSSSRTVNAIHEAAGRAYLSNLMGYPTDCPQREKNGWTGDAHIAIATGLFNFDAFTVYEKWMADHRDEQQPNGVLPDIIPTCGWGYRAPEANGNGLDWTSTIALIPWNLYAFYGDEKPLRDCYDNIRRYVDYALRGCKDGLTSWGRGDWVPVTTRSDKTLVTSCYLYADLQILTAAAGMFGFGEDLVKYREAASMVRDAINARFLDESTGIYAGGMQTDLSLPLVFGVVPENCRGKVAAALAKRVEQDKWHVNAGVHGTKAVLNALSENGYAEAAYRIATATDYPSWGWWMENGRTTLVENWKLDAPRDNSDNHIMFGDIDAWFYRCLGGINPDQPGFKHITLRPYFPKDMNSFQCAHDCPYGTISSGWERKGRKVTYTAVIPCGCSATFVRPDGKTEELGSGTYRAVFK